jgi:transcriptional regulator with XRE-family HTH domain
MLGRNIKKYRLLSGMSVGQMAKKLGVSSQIIKRYEDDTMIPNSERLIEIAKLFNVSISDLVYSYDPQVRKEIALIEKLFNDDVDY